MTADWLILTRAVHFGACLIFFGVFAFDRFAADRIVSREQFQISKFWQARVRWFNWILLPIILLSGIFWFALVAATMGETPFGQLFQNEILKTVWNQTQFGMVWKIRLAFWLAAAVASVLFYFSKWGTVFQRFLIWFQFFFSGLLLGSLAWAGHGQEGARWHLFADVLHLLVAGIWPMGLLPFILLFCELCRNPGSAHGNSIAVLVSRFSAISLAAVALLTATGFVNGWFLVGSFSNLIGQIYGRWLLAKIIFFCVAVAIGAVNLLRLKPRLLINNSETQGAQFAAARLQFNVRLELFLAALIVIVVAVLGILPPAVH